MTECRKPEIQDLLPDYVVASLDAAQMSVVEQHLPSCEPCADDVVLLRRVRALPHKSANIDVARIAAALPRPTKPVVLRLEPSTVRRSSANSTMRPRRWSASVWQAAAAVGVMVVGGASVLVSRNAPPSILAERSNDVRLGEAAESVLVGTSLVAASTGATDSAESARAANGRGAVAGRVSVSYGDLGNYSEAELQRMLDRLERWDGASSTEPLPTLPVVSSPGGY